MSTRWLTRAEAAERVGRNERTIRRWEAGPGGLRVVAGRCREAEVLAMDKTMRANKGGRPRKGPEDD